MNLLSPILIWLAIMAIVAFVPTYFAYRQGLLRRAYHRDVLAVAALAFLAVGFFWQPIFEENVWIPAGGGDMASMLYPNFHFIGESLRQGELPLWNPRMFIGQPFAADIQTGVFYPINLVFWFLVNPVTYEALEWLVIFHFFLAGFLMYVLLCSLTVGEQRPMNRLAALAGGVAFMFSDFFITHIGNLNLIAVAAWLPLIFLFFHRALLQRSFRFAVAGGLSMGIAFLAGHIQPFLYIAVALGLYFLFHAYIVGRNRRRRMELPRLVGVVLVFGLVTFGSMAIQFLPSQELADLSVRSEISYKASTEYSLSAGQLVSLVVPDFFGRGPNGYWGQWQRTETGYMGIFTLVAAALALLLRRERVAYFLGGLGALGIFLALGGATVLQGWLFEFLPGFEKVRAPARFIFLFNFAVAALAALGLDALLRPLKRPERAILAKATRGLGVAVLLFAVLVLPAMLLIWMLNRDQPEAVLVRLTGTTEGAIVAVLLLLISLGLLVGRQRGWAKRSTIGLLAVALIAFDLISAGHDLEITTEDPTAGYQHQAVLDFLKQEQGYYRVDTDTNVWDIWQPNAAPLHALTEVQGARHPMVLSTFNTYWSELGSRSIAMYDLLNVKYIVGRKDVPLDFDKWKLAFDADPQFEVYRNINVLPRAFVVNRATVEPNLDAHITRMHDSGFNPRQEVLLEQGEPLGGLITTASQAAIITYRNNEVVIDVSTEAPGYLVLADMYDAGWHAEVDGGKAPVLRANYTLRAVPIGPGNHQVRMYFSPASWEMGRLITLATWLVILTWVIVAVALALRRRRMMARQVVERRDQLPGTL